MSLIQRIQCAIPAAENMDALHRIESMWVTHVRSLGQVLYEIARLGPFDALDDRVKTSFRNGVRVMLINMVCVRDFRNVGF